MPNPYSLTPAHPQDPGRLFVLAFADERTAFSLRETHCQMEEEQVLERLKPFAGRCQILQCNMPAENEILLRDLLECGESRLPSAVTTPTESQP